MITGSSRLARWHVESEAMNQALAIVVAAQGKLPMSRVWGMGTSASSDGQFSRQRGMAKP
jgi:TnpA family transposase